MGLVKQVVGYETKSCMHSGLTKTHNPYFIPSLIVQFFFSCHTTKIQLLLYNLPYIST